MYKADIPTNERLITSTFADDTAILSRSRRLSGASWEVAIRLANQN